MTRKFRFGPACYHVLHMIPIQVAQDMNFFYDEGLRDGDGLPNYEILSGGLAPFMFERETLAQRMKEQSIDIAMDVKPSTVAYLQRQGHDLRIVAGWRNQSGSHLVSHPSLRRFEDLRGKRIGVIDYDDIIVTRIRPWLKRAGLDPYHDVIWVRGNPPPEARDRLRAGEIDVCQQDPADSQVLQGEGFHLLMDWKAQFPNGRPDRIIVATGQAVEERPGDVKACVKGMIRAYWHMRRQPETFAQCEQVERRLRINSPDPEEQRRRLSCASPGHVERLPFPFNGLPTALGEYLQEAVEVGVLEEMPDVERLCDLSLARQGFAELAARPELKPELERVQQVVERLGY